MHAELLKEQAGCVAKTVTFAKASSQDHTVQEKNNMEKLSLQSKGDKKSFNKREQHILTMTGFGGKLHHHDAGKHRTSSFPKAMLFQRPLTDNKSTFKKANPQKDHEEICVSLGYRLEHNFKEDITDSTLQWRLSSGKAVGSISPDVKSHLFVETADS